MITRRLTETADNLKVAKNFAARQHHHSLPVRRRLYIVHFYNVDTPLLLCGAGVV